MGYDTLRLLIILALVFAPFQHLGTMRADYAHGQSYGAYENFLNETTVAYANVEGVRTAEETHRARLRQNTAQNYGGNCVTFAKRYTGYYGTWGNGGRNLSLNSGPKVGAIVIFNYIHVAVVVADNGQAITIIESNYIAKNTVGYRTLMKNDPTIRGYHSF